MAYQNIVSPRIFIDYFQYAAAIEPIDWTYDVGGGFAPQNSNMFMNPLRPATRQDGFGGGSCHYFFRPSSPIYGMNFYAMLGHNMGGVPVGPLIQYGGINVEGNDIQLADVRDGGGEIINFDFNTPTSSIHRYGTPRQNGFSMWEFPELTADIAYATLDNPDGGTIDVQFRDYFCYSTSSMYPAPLQGASPWGSYVVGFTPVCGRIFEFENAPDLKLTMERDFEGAKIQKTISGGDVSNTTFTGPPNWPLSGNPWTLTAPNPGYAAPAHAGARVGRRKWKLKFSMLRDHYFSDNKSKGLFSVTETATPYGVDTSSDAGYTQGEDWDNADMIGDNLGPQDVFLHDHWTNDSFMGLVYAKTLSFSLPFIFQIDKNNNSPDQFCIAKIDAKSFKVTQSSFKRYDISLTIREVF